MRKLGLASGFAAHDFFKNRPVSLDRERDAGYVPACPKQLWYDGKRLSEAHG
ncbi:MAG: hypothetical protein IT462_15475 [Planctomycetes bacterium]|nr:hypothetical protein [Planctomycetota bacterium]